MPPPGYENALRVTVMDVFIGYLLQSVHLVMMIVRGTSITSIPLLMLLMCALPMPLARTVMTAIIILDAVTWVLFGNKEVGTFILREAISWLGPMPAALLYVMWAWPAFVVVTMLWMLSLVYRFRLPVRNALPIAAVITTMGRIAKWW